MIDKNILYKSNNDSGDLLDLMFNDKEKNDFCRNICYFIEKIKNYDDYISYQVTMPSPRSTNSEGENNLINQIKYDKLNEDGNSQQNKEPDIILSSEENRMRDEQKIVTSVFQIF